MFADIFSGIDVVASIFSDNTTIITNDLLYCNYLCNVAWFGSENIRLALMEELVDKYNNLENSTEVYMTKIFTNTYFNNVDCRKIGCIREDIEKSIPQDSSN